MAGKWAPRTAEAILAMLARDVFDAIGNKPIALINAPMLLIMLRRIEARGAGRCILLIELEAYVVRYFATEWRLVDAIEIQPEI